MGIVETGKTGGRVFPPALEPIVDRYHEALDVFLAGDPEPLAKLYSQAHDVTLANPFGPPVRGWRNVEETMRRAAANYRDGYATGFERVSDYASDELAYMVEIERYESKVGGAEELAPIAVRVTTIYRHEGGDWRVVHRHADPTISDRPAEHVLGRA
jgi:ketosteroid isomerase-like protein